MMRRERTRSTPASWRSYRAALSFLPATILMLQVFNIPQLYAPSDPPATTQLAVTNTEKPRRLLFEPGTLSLNKSQTIEQCYVGTKGNYEERLKSSGSCVYSAKYNLILVVSGKTGSSTQRKIMMDKFKGVGRTCRALLNLDGGARYIVATRDPVDRFMSAYKEMAIKRSRLYKGKLDEKKLARIPKKYQRFARKLKELRSKQRLQLLKSSTHENVAFNTRLMEMFVEDYDGKNVFDSHLSLQSIKLWSFNSSVREMNHFDFVLETANLTAGLAALAREVGAPEPKEYIARQSPHDMLNLTAVQDSTYQKICRLTARDFCCLNYKMPEACRRHDIPKGERVMCEWVPNQDGSGVSIKAVLV